VDPESARQNGGRGAEPAAICRPKNAVANERKLWKTTSEMEKLSRPIIFA